MSFSIQRAVSDGTLDTIVLSIEYFDQTDISVYVDDVLLPDGTYTWVWDGLDIKITPAVANGSEVLVRRTTKFDDMYHNFDDGAVFNDTTMDDNFRQLLFIFQEGVEGLTATDFYADLNLHGYRLRKVGNAVEPDDAVPFSQYQADANGAFQQRLLAEAAANAAGVSQGAAAGSAVSAANSAASASASASTATTQATNASNSAASAASSASSASTSATDASNFAASASTSATNAAASAAAAAASAASINDANLVHKTGNESIDGIKTFTSSPVLPGNATTALQAVPKQQLDAVSSVVDGLVNTQPLHRAPKNLSGTSVTFSPADSTGIPSWATEVVVSVHNLSTTVTSSYPILKLGTSAGLVSTGYNGSGSLIGPSSVSSNTLTSGFNVGAGSAGWSSGVTVSGSFRLTRSDATSNTWALSGTLGRSDSAGTYLSAGDVVLPGVLDRINIQTSDLVATFDGSGGFISVTVRA